MLSGLEFRSVISCRGWCSCWIRLYLSFTPYNRYIRSVLFGIRKQKKSLRGRHPWTGRLKSAGKSNRPGTVRTGYRSDSPGIVYQFPVQRSSGSVREALRLPRSERLRDAKIFSTLFRCPVHGCRPRRDFFVRLNHKSGTDLPTYFIHEKFIV